MPAYQGTLIRSSKRRTLRHDASMESVFNFASTMQQIAEKKKQRPGEKKKEKKSWTHKAWGGVNTLYSSLADKRICCQAVARRQRAMLSSESMERER